MRIAVDHLAAITGVFLLTLASTPQASTAQVNASEKGSITQIISGTEIEIEYSRPSIRGRGDLFGGQIFWGQVWTPGANQATTLRVSNAVTLNGVELPAGKYSLWIEVLASDPWTLVVHEDTLRTHGNHPLVEEGLITVAVEHSHSPRFIETLSFDIQVVRPTSARLEMSWGNTLVHVDLGIDPGFEVAVDAEVAEPLIGGWLYDDSPQVPSDEVLEARLANPDLPDDARTYFTVLRDLQRPRWILFNHDPETGYLTMSDPIQAAMMQTLSGEPEGAQTEGSAILLPRGAGTFVMGYLMGGELAFYDPRFASIFEFDFDDEGRAVSFVLRDQDDDIEATGVRR
jgi:hypothetical protein